MTVMPQTAERRRWRYHNDPEYRARTADRNSAHQKADVQANPEKYRARRQQYQQHLKEQVFGHYGWTCACCGSDDRISIDHIAGNGKEHRMELFGAGGPKVSSVRMHVWLVKNNFPEGFQTLCMPCNTSKHDGPACRINHERN
jgi:5-methylcytosine-specific restriction endonuclease McrA